MTIREKPIGYARLDRLDDESAEVAFNVADAHHGKGIGSILLEHLAAIGLELGVARFVADVLPENRKMLGVLQTAGYAVHSGHEQGYISVSFDITPTAQSRAVQQAREHRAESLSVRRILTPRSVAVVGASRAPRSVGHSFLRNLTAGGFRGRVYAVNPAATEVLGMPCYPSVSAVPGPVDMAVIAVPAQQVLGVVDECATKGVGSLVVPSGHFAESGPQGLALQRRAARPGLARRDAGDRTRVLRHHQQQPALAAQRLAGRIPAAARAVGPVRRKRVAGHRAAGVRAPAQPRAVGLRFGRQPC